MLINVAIGGTNGYFPDSWTNNNGAKPWNNNSPTAMRDFWQAKNTWYATTLVSVRKESKLSLSSNKYNTCEDFLNKFI